MCSHPVSCVHANLAAATVQKPIVVSLDTTVQAAIAAMSGVRAQCSSDRSQSPDNTLHLEARSSCVVVVEQDRVVGILTERDVVRLSAQQHPLDQLPIAQVMTQPVITLRESDLIDLFTTINLLQQHRIRHVPIVDDQDCLIGLVTHESLRQLTRPVDLLRLRRVQEVMTSSVLCASPDSSMLEIARLMTERRVSSVVITIPGGSADAPFHRAVGLLTERDLVQFQALELSLPETLAREVMSSPVFTITPIESLWTVQKVMEQQWIRRVIVAGEQGELLGIVTQTSLLQAFNPLELYNLAEVLEKKVTRLEAERISLLEIRAVELERQVAERTQTIQVQAERDRLMAGLSSQILASLDVQVILDTTVRQVRRILGCDRVNIWQFEDEWVTVVVAESTQSDLSLLGKRIADTCFQQTQAEIYRHGHVRVVPDIYNTEMSDCHRDMLAQIQTRAKLLVPLCCGDQLWGLLNVTEMRPRDWQPTEVEFLRSLSTQLAIALQQATRHQQLQDEIHDRQQAELELAQLNAELEARVAERTAELEAREARYRALMEGASDAILLADTEGYLIEANQTAADLVGYDRHELVGMHFTQLHPPDTLPTLTLAFEALINREHAGTLSLEFLRRDGQRIPVEATASVINVGGETIAQAIFHDIRDRKRYEAALQESQQFLQTILDTVPLSVFWKDRTSNYLGANQRFLQDAALSSVSELVGKTDLDLPWGTTEAEDYRTDDRAVIESGKANLGIIETQYQQDGTIIWLETNKLPLRNLAGDVIGVLGTYQDITERHNTEIALQRQLALIEAAVNGIAILEDGRYLYLNSSHVELFGYQSTQELIGQSWRVLYSPEELERFDQEIWPALYKQMSWQGEVVGTRKDGTTFPEQVSLTLSEDNLLICVCEDISDRKQVETALQESQRRYATLAQAVPVAIFRFDLQGQCTYVNERWSDMTGKPIAFAMGDRWLETIHPDDRERSQTASQQWLQSGAAMPFQHEARILRDDGSIVWYYCQIIVETDTNGQPIGYVGTLTDISDRQAAELALNDSEIRFRRVFESNVVGMMFTDFGGQITDANDRFLDIIGYSRADLEAHRINWTQITPPEYVESDQRAIDQLERYGEILPWEKEYVRPDGRRVAVLIGVALLSKHDGRCVCAVVDISDRKQSENALRESEEKFRQLAEVVDAVFWILHLNRLDRVYVSPAYERIWGRPCTELYVTPDAWVDMIHAEDQERVLAAIPKQIQGTFDEEYRIIRPDGTQRWIHDRAFPIRNAQGEVYRLAGIAEDITERKRSEKIIRQQAARETVLREISQRIRESLNLQTIFDTACQEIRTCLQADRVGIFKFYPNADYNDGEFVAESVVNGFPSVVAMRVHDHCFGENYASLYAQGRYYVIDDIYQNGSVTCHTNILSEFQVRANLVMPLLCNDQLWGLLCIHQCDGPRHWHQPEIDLGQQLANQLAIAIQQAILYKQLQAELQERQRAEATITQQLRQQTALELILQQIRQSLNLPELLAIATQQVQELLGSDRVIVFQVCHDSHSQIVEEAVAPNLPQLKSMQWGDEIWSPEILEHYWQGQPRIVPDVMNDIWTGCLVDYSQTGQIQSKIVAPILQELHDSEAHRWVSPESKNKLWGVLVVHACHTRRVWHQDEAQLLQQIANQLAIAIQQSHLFEQLQQELTERQLTQQQLTERNQELLRATRLKDEFLANMSHELRTPLNAILGMSEGLQDDVFGPVNEEQIRALQTIERSGQHLLELINDILDVAKIEAGQVELDCQPTAIANLCQSSLSFIKQQALNKRIQLAVNLPLRLPDIILDERRIRQVLINLLNNAVKFTPEGGRITLEVSHWSHSREDESQTYLRFSISDTGIGISPDDIQKLFQPFVQIDSALNRRYQGTGLGLALVKQIVDLHHGQVMLTSELGVGSCFTVDLPYLSASCDGSTIDPDPPDPCSIVHSSPLILLAEDNEANIRTIASYLRAKGYQLILARNGQEAIALAQSECPNIILMDIQMPEMDGLEAMQTIRRHSKLTEVPIIALTSLAMEGDRDRCIAAGASDYLSKPVKLKQLLMAIQHQLNLGKESS
ncbi:MAG: PAS domain S-box protein [Synechococcales cyanobacterium K44_A2020_017]|nr:PAS domain S-box protein [Synechococcales cyanobacterium K32_A2020_035]MBF2093668.1 PAS domain S-box protein [Synechococcales cyanobacterium K44_A2020_017]